MHSKKITVLLVYVTGFTQLLKSVKCKVYHQSVSEKMNFLVVIDISNQK
jgi:hypothetical protein